MRILFALALAGCTTGSTPSTPAIDAQPADAPPAVMLLAKCPDSVAGTIQDSPTMFIPKETTISVGQVVKFIITAEHFVIPNTLTTTDDALRIGYGQTKCFQFNTPGVFGFLCGVHSFTGTITVQ